jgi:hypothetical protein
MAGAWPITTQRAGSVNSSNPAHTSAPLKGSPNRRKMISAATREQIRSAFDIVDVIGG